MIHVSKVVRYTFLLITFSFSALGLLVESSQAAPGWLQQEEPYAKITKLSSHFAKGAARPAEAVAAYQLQDKKDSDLGLLVTRDSKRVIWNIYDNGFLQAAVVEPNTSDGYKHGKVIYAEQAAALLKQQGLPLPGKVPVDTSTLNLFNPFASQTSIKEPYAQPQLVWLIIVAVGISVASDVISGETSIKKITEHAAMSAVTAYALGPLAGKIVSRAASFGIVRSMGSRLASRLQGVVKLNNKRKAWQLRSYAARKGVTIRYAQKVCGRSGPVGTLCRSTYRRDGRKIRNTAVTNWRQARDAVIRGVRDEKIKEQKFGVAGVHCSSAIRKTRNTLAWRYARHFAQSYCG